MLYNYVQSSEIYVHKCILGFKTIESSFQKELPSRRLITNQVQPLQLPSSCFQMNNRSTLIIIIKLPCGIKMWQWQDSCSSQSLWEIKCELFSITNWAKIVSQSVLQAASLLWNSGKAVVVAASEQGSYFVLLLGQKGLHHHHHQQLGTALILSSATVQI